MNKSINYNNNLMINYYYLKHKLKQQINYNLNLFKLNKSYHHYLKKYNKKIKLYKLYNKNCKY